MHGRIPELHPRRRRHQPAASSTPVMRQTPHRPMRDEIQSPGIPRPGRQPQLHNSSDRSTRNPSEETSHPPDIAAQGVIIPGKHFAPNASDQHFARITGISTPKRGMNRRRIELKRPKQWTGDHSATRVQPLVPPTDSMSPARRRDAAGTSFDYAFFPGVLGRGSTPVLMALSIASMKMSSSPSVVYVFGETRMP